MIESRRKGVERVLEHMRKISEAKWKPVGKLGDMQVLSQHMTQ